MFARIYGGAEGSVVRAGRGDRWPAGGDRWPAGDSESW
jgi:hypothetical protein